MVCVVLLCVPQSRARLRVLLGEEFMGRSSKATRGGATLWKSGGDSQPWRHHLEHLTRHARYKMTGKLIFETSTGFKDLTNI